MKPKKPKRETPLSVSASKLAIAKTIEKIGVEAASQFYGKSADKMEKIMRQVKNRLEQIAICRVYQPFTTRSSKRRPRQVGA